MYLDINITTNEDCVNIVNNKISIICIIITSKHEVFISGYILINKFFNSEYTILANIGFNNCA